MEKLLSFNLDEEIAKGNRSVIMDDGDDDVYDDDEITVVTDDSDVDLDRYDILSEEEVDEALERQAPSAFEQWQRYPEDVQRIYPEEWSNAGMTEHRYKGTIEWGAYYRANPEKFAKDYLGIVLLLFQESLLWEMFSTNSYSFYGSRGIGKSFIVAIYAVIKCILYPGAKVLISSMTRKQAELIITEKILGHLMHVSPNLWREIKREGQNYYDKQLGQMKFHNGSTIQVTNSGVTEALRIV